MTAKPLSKVYISQGMGERRRAAARDSHVGKIAR